MENERERGEGGSEARRELVATYQVWRVIEGCAGSIHGEDDKNYKVN
jgi:hypothetical protein